MSIQTAIQNAQQKVANAYTAVSEKGGTLPATQNLSNLPIAIGSISGGSATLITKNITQNGTYNASSDNADGYSSVTVNVPSSGGGGIPREVNSNGKYGYPVNNFSFSLPSNATDLGDYALASAFNHCSSLVSVDLSVLTAITGAQAVSFNYCTNLTSIDLSNLVEISSSGLHSAFSNCTKLTSVDLSNLTTLSGIQAMDSIFWGCTSLISLSFDSLTTVTGASALGYLCEQCTNLTSVSFPELTALQANNVFRYAFDQCTSLTSVSFPKLVNLRSYNNIFSYAFQDCTSLTDIRFPALNSTSFTGSTSQFNYMLTRVTGCTVHFPSNLQSIIGSWSSVTSGFGGTNTVVLFDLPATE